jgi:peptidoglycan-associated lipoprotein
MIGLPRKRSIFARNHSGSRAPSISDRLVGSEIRRRGPGTQAQTKVGQAPDWQQTARDIIPPRRPDNGIATAIQAVFKRQARRFTNPEQERSMIRLTSASSLATIAILMAACSSTPIAPPAAPPPAPKVVEAAPPPPAPRPPAPPAAPQVAPESKVATVSLPAYLDPKNPLATDRSVFFDFDAFVVKSNYSALVERHGKFLGANPTVKIKIEGNADERGSSEYNLALGQKRAVAVLAALKITGAREEQMEPVSWGKERPRATGHDEDAWTQNRRADLAYPAK